jgi:hypothetical protein
MLNFDEAPPADADGVHDTNKGLRKAQVILALQARPGQWAKVYGTNTSMPNGLARSGISEWGKIPHIELKRTVIDENAKDNERRYNVWLRWTGGVSGPVTTVTTFNQGHAAPNVPTPPAPPRPVAAGPVPAAPVPVPEPAGQTAFQKMYGGFGQGNVDVPEDRTELA